MKKKLSIFSPKFPTKIILIGTPEKVLWNHTREVDTEIHQNFRNSLEFDLLYCNRVSSFISVV